MREGLWPSQAWRLTPEARARDEIQTDILTGRLITGRVMTLWSSEALTGDISRSGVQIPPAPYFCTEPNGEFLVCPGLVQIATVSPENVEGASVRPT